MNIKQAKYLKALIDGTEVDPLYLYENKIEKIFIKRIANNSIDKYVDNCVSLLSEDDQAKLLGLLLPMSVDIFQPWYTKKLKELLNYFEDKNASTYNELHSIYTFYKKEFDSVVI